MHLKKAPNSSIYKESRAFFTQSSAKLRLYTILHNISREKSLNYFITDMENIKCFYRQYFVCGIPAGYIHSFRQNIWNNSLNG